MGAGVEWGQDHIEDACGVALPHPQNPPSNPRVLCEHHHLSKVWQVEFKATCNHVRRELYLLGKTNAATSAEVLAKMTQTICFSVILL